MVKPQPVVPPRALMLAQRAHTPAFQKRFIADPTTHLQLLCTTFRSHTDDCTRIVPFIQRGSINIAIVESPQREYQIMINEVGGVPLSDLVSLAGFFAMLTSCYAGVAGGTKPSCASWVAHLLPSLIYPQNLLVAIVHPSTRAVRVW
jgi:hypothetical protein